MNANELKAHAADLVARITSLRMRLFDHSDLRHGAEIVSMSAQLGLLSMDVSSISSKIEFTEMLIQFPELDANFDGFQSLLQDIERSVVKMEDHLRAAVGT